MLPSLLCCPLSVPPLSYRSYTHLSILYLERPLLLFPGMSTSSILLTMCSSFILITWAYHFSRCSVIFLDACTALVVPPMCSLRILSLLVTPISILVNIFSIQFNSLFQTHIRSISHNYMSQHNRKMQKQHINDSLRSLAYTLASVMDI